MTFSSKAPAAPKLKESVWALVGATIAISGTLFLTHMSGLPWLMAPFGATCVLIFGLPDSPLAQPRSVVGGHLVAAFIGMLLLIALGSAWWSQALAVGLSIFAMQQTRTVHAPAGATPLVIIASEPSWSFMLFPVVTGAWFLVLVACLYHKVRQKDVYPKYWY